MDESDVVIITCSSGNIDTAAIHRLAVRYRIAGFNNPGPLYSSTPVHCVVIHMKSQASIEAGLKSVRPKLGNRIASVIRFVGYYSSTEEPSPKYYTMNVLCTRHLLDALQEFGVEQFVCAGATLYKPTAPGRPISEYWLFKPARAYPRSRAETEAIIAGCHRKSPYAKLRVRGVYHENFRLPRNSSRADLIHERQWIRYVFRRDVIHGEAFVHRNDLVDVFARMVKQLRHLPAKPTLLIYAPQPVSYAAMQCEFGRLDHRDEWKAYAAPKAIDKIGAWAEETALAADQKSLIKPWMINWANDHDELGTVSARKLLDCEYEDRLIDTSVKMVGRLTTNPVAWYRENKLRLPDELQKQATSAQSAAVWPDSQPQNLLPDM